MLVFPNLSVLFVFSVGDWEQQTGWTWAGLCLHLLTTCENVQRSFCQVRVSVPDVQSRSFKFNS